MMSDFVYSHSSLILVAIFFLLFIFFILAFALLWKNKRDSDNVRKRIIASIGVLVQALEARDNYTRHHSGNVSIYGRELGELLKLGKKTLDDLWMGGLIHDIGKIGIPEYILNKPSTLSSDEFDIIKQHPLRGKEILEPIPFMNHLLPIVLHHHEKIDGSGYPNGLRDNNIPFLARIIAVADVFDALSTDRAYRKRLDKNSIIKEFHLMSGTHLDASICRILLENIDHFLRMGRVRE